MKAIINADDFGYSRGVNLGIIDAYNLGVVRSTTLMANMPGCEDAIMLAKENPGLGVGIHLTLTAGKTVGGVYKTISDKNGNFLNLTELEKRAKNGELDMREVENEYEAQINKAKDLGLMFDHFDSHHHTHNLPNIVNIFLKLAKKYNVAVRIYDKSLLSGEYSSIKTTSEFSEDFYADGVSIDNIQKILSVKDVDSIEIMAHPAYVDSILYAGSSYNIGRTKELDVLTSSSLLDFLEKENISLANFKDL
jgi:predicted glycoside hydrolase/deacetylase ChbG (UPF0249 family)